MSEIALASEESNLFELFQALKSSRRSLRDRFRHRIEVGDGEKEKEKFARLG
jgi:hypothetical protein